MSNSKLTHVDETGAARQKTAPLPHPAACLTISGGWAGERGGGRSHLRAPESIRAALPHPDEPENCS